MIVHGLEATWPDPPSNQNQTYFQKGAQPFVSLLCAIQLCLSQVAHRPALVHIPDVCVCVCHLLRREHFAFFDMPTVDVAQVELSALATIKRQCDQLSSRCQSRDRLVMFISRLFAVLSSPFVSVCMRCLDNLSFRSVRPLHLVLMRIVDKSCSARPVR